MPWDPPLPSYRVDVCEPRPRRGAGLGLWTARLALDVRGFRSEASPVVRMSCSCIYIDARFRRKSISPIVCDSASVSLRTVSLTRVGTVTCQCRAPHDADDRMSVGSQMTDVDRAQATSDVVGCGIVRSQSMSCCVPEARAGRGIRERARARDSDCNRTSWSRHIERRHWACQ